MEKFWNLLHYFVYKAHHSATYFFYKYSGMFWLYDVPFIKKRFMNKFNIEKPQEFLMQWWGNPHSGGSTWFSYIWLNLAFMPPCILSVFLYERIFGLPNSPIPYIILIISWGAILMLISHKYLIMRDKYISYFRLYDKQNHKWKVKWGLISLLIIIIPLIISVISVIFLPRL